MPARAERDLLVDVLGIRYARVVGRDQVRDVDEVVGSVLMNGVRVGPGAVVRNAILDKNVIVPPGAQIGVDAEADRAHGFVVEDGLTVLAKGQAVPPPAPA